ncbi:MAG: hypothetical protein KDK36_05385, partial [Leptospiraceae bacterium]|nr:hypothetical protein [Leptospiraceae bacterium]
MREELEDENQEEIPIAEVNKQFKNYILKLNPNKRILKFTNFQGIHYLKTISEIPKEINRLINLKEIDLSFQEITKIPIEFFELKNLETIKFDGCRIKKIPGEIKKLKNMKSIEMTGNQLVELPPEIGDLKNLKILNIYGNKLKTLPKEIGKLTNLKELGIGSNKIETLPVEIGNLNNLELLDIFYNPKLKKLPDSVSKLTNLKLTMNSISELKISEKELLKLPGYKEKYELENEAKKIKTKLSSKKIEEVKKGIVEFRSWVERAKKNIFYSENGPDMTLFGIKIHEGDYLRQEVKLFDNLIKRFGDSIGNKYLIDLCYALYCSHESYQEVQTVYDVIGILLENPDNKTQKEILNIIKKGDSFITFPPVEPRVMDDLCIDFLPELEPKLLRELLMYADKKIGYDTYCELIGPA